MPRNSATDWSRFLRRAAVPCGTAMVMCACCCDFLIDSGVQGLQGFQPECGMLLQEIVTRRTRDGERLVIFGPLAVTTELPVCTPEEIHAKVRHAIEVCKGNASLVLFTSNTINPDVPLANIKAMYSAVKS